MRVKLSGLVLGVLLSSSAWANCDGVDKCFMRNPLGAHECWLKVRVCPLSTESVMEWVNGATPDTVSDALKDIDPTRAFRYYSQKMGIEEGISDKTLDCFVSYAATGAFGAYCAAGVSALGTYCFADISCTSSCIGTKEAATKTIRMCLKQ